MKKFMAAIACAFLATASNVIAQNSLENDPAYLEIDKAFDFKTIKPEVNINLPKFLLKDALADLDKSKNDPSAKSDINISELIQDIKLIRVVVMEGKNKTNSDAVAKGVATLRSILEQKWTPVAVVSEEKEKVGIYAISDASGESTAGLALLVHEEGGDTVIANVVGRVSLGKIVKAASQKNLFPKDLLKKLTTATENGGAEKTKDSAEKPAN